MKIISLASVFVLFAIISCSKGSGGNDPGKNCTSVTNVTATPSATTIQKGQTLNFQAQALSNVIFNWVIPGGAPINNSATGTVSNIDFVNKGWYYLTATNSCNEIKKDSFYVNVTVPQGSATCAPASNSVSYTAAGHQNGTFTSIHLGETVTGYEFDASGNTGGDFAMVFHSSYKNNNTPPDGIYTTGTFNANGLPNFGSNDLDKIFVIMITYWPTTIYYRSTPGQKVYISRSGGKAKAVICDMPLVGSSNGTPYSTNMTVSATEQ